MFIGIRLSFILVCKQEIGPFQSGTLPPPWGKTSIYGMPTFRCDQAGRSRGAWVQCGQNDSNGFLNEEWFHSYFCFLLGLRVVRILLVQCCARPSGKWKECPLEVESLQKGTAEQDELKTLLRNFALYTAVNLKAEVHTAELLRINLDEMWSDKFPIGIPI